MQNLISALARLGTRSAGAVCRAAEYNSHAMRVRVIASGANPNNHQRQRKADTYRTTDHHR
jgi:hypothetical protein